MLTLKRPQDGGKCQSCWGRIPRGEPCYYRPTGRHCTLAYRCTTCGDFPPPPDPPDRSWYDKERLASGSYRMRSTWTRDVSSCLACRKRVHFGDWIYWRPTHGPRCAACGDYPPTCAAPVATPSSWLTSREIDWLRSVARSSLIEVN